MRTIDNDVMAVGFVVPPAGNSQADWQYQIAGIAAGE
jgi:hypothetical protein